VSHSRPDNGYAQWETRFRVADVGDNEALSRGYSTIVDFFLAMFYIRQFRTNRTKLVKFHFVFMNSRPPKTRFNCDRIAELPICG